MGWMNRARTMSETNFILIILFFFLFVSFFCQFFIFSSLFLTLLSSLTLCFVFYSLICSPLLQKNVTCEGQTDTLEYEVTTLTYILTRACQVGGYYCVQRPMKAIFIKVTALCENHQLEDLKRSVIIFNRCTVKVHLSHFLHLTFAQSYQCSHRNTFCHCVHLGCFPH